MHLFESTFLKILESNDIDDKFVFFDSYRYITPKALNLLNSANLLLHSNSFSFLRDENKNPTFLVALRKDITTPYTRVNFLTDNKVFRLGDLKGTGISLGLFDVVVNFILDKVKEAQIIQSKLENKHNLKLDL